MKLSFDQCNKGINFLVIQPVILQILLKTVIYKKKVQLSCAVS